MVGVFEDVGDKEGKWVMMVREEEEIGKVCDMKMGL